MIYGIGTDIVRIERMQENLEKYPEKFAQRILSENEMLEFSAHNQQARLLAKRFAAKEAASKALGTGFRNGITLRQIEITHDKLGKPQLVFYAEADAYIKNAGITSSFVSLSDESDYAVAYVILEL